MHCTVDSDRKKIWIQLFCCVSHASSRNFLFRKYMHGITISVVGLGTLLALVLNILLARKSKHEESSEILDDKDNTGHVNLAIVSDGFINTRDEKTKIWNRKKKKLQTSFWWNHTPCLSQSVLKFPLDFGLEVKWEKFWKTSKTEMDEYSSLCFEEHSRTLLDVHKFSRENCSFLHFLSQGRQHFPLFHSTQTQWSGVEFPSPPLSQTKKQK